MKTSIQFLSILLLLSLCIPAYATAAPPSVGLAGYWDFNEGSGQTAADKSGNGNNGILSSGVQWTTGKFGSGVTFDSINDYVNVTKNTDINFNGDFTVSLWINPTEWKINEPLFSNGMVRIFHRGDYAGNNLYFLTKITSNADPGDSSWGGWAGVKTLQPPSENNWHSIIGVKSGNKMTIYLDGVKSPDVDITGYSTDNSGLGDLFIGSDKKINFNGAIDEVRIWNRALTASEIQNSYQYPPMFLPIGDMTATEGSPLTFTVVAMDAYDRSLSYSVSDLPPGAGFSPVLTTELFPPYYDSGPKFSWTPARADIGTHHLCFTVSNGASSTSECITITVNKNYLLHPADCPSGFIVRGDGICTENVHRSYGADAKPTSDPLGGGVGYSGSVDPGSADFTVRTRTELLSALKSATSGQVIYVAADATINMTGDHDIAIPAGVTLASGRGRSNSLGALIYSNALLTDHPLFITAGEGVRVTGIRLQGPDPERRSLQMKWLDAQGLYYSHPVAQGIFSSYSDLTVDNCELYGWNHAAVYINLGSHNNHIHHNFIHHNQLEGLGYGIVFYRGTDALIEANVFDWNRHSIAASRGTPGMSYEARYNLVLEHSLSHYFDMHGGNDISDPAVPAGGYVKVHHNTFMGSIERAVAIRGVPIEGVWVYDNWAVYDMKTFTEKEIFTQLLDNLPGHTPYEKMSVYDNWYGTTPPPSGTSTPTVSVKPTPTITTVTPTPAVNTMQDSIGVLRSRQWILDYGTDGTVDRRFNYGSDTDIPLAGDFNNDGTSDIGVFRSGQWFLDYGMDATTNRRFTFGTATDTPLVGDFNNDGTTDIGVFRSGQWILDYGMDGTVDRRFQYGLATDTPLVGDFNNDGTTDIGVFRSGQWILDYGMDGTVNHRFNFGTANDIPVAGGFSSSGTTDIGVFRSGQWILDYGTDGAVDRRFNFGLATDIPIVEKWN